MQEYGPYKMKSIIYKAKKNFTRDKYLWLLVFPAIVYFILFKYIPMYGIIIAFKDFSISKGILGSEWVGFKYFLQFFAANDFLRILRNTLIISLYTIIYGFPAPIILALILNECRFSFFKKTVQTMSYLPYFISTVVVVGILVNFVNPINGIVNQAITFFGGNSINFLGEPQWFRSLYVLTNIWQYAGWNSIIYLAALSNIDQELYESAVIDGANRMTSLLHITLPSIMPTIVIMLIIRMGNLMGVGMEKVLLMYNPGIYETADVISTYVYRRGLVGMQYSFGVSVGLFNSLINTGFLLLFNALARRYTDASLF